MAELELTDEIMGDIVKSVTEGLDLDTKMETVAASAAEAAAKAVFEKFDKPLKKDIVDEDEVEEVDESGEAVKGLINENISRSVEKSIVKRYFGERVELTKDFSSIVKSKYANMTREMRFFTGIKALIEKDQETIKELNSFAGELFALNAHKSGKLADLAQKAGYANDAVSADGGALVPDPEFNTTVYENLPKYGVIFSEGNVRNTDRVSVYALSLTGTIAFTKVGEAGAIGGTKLAFGRAQKNLIKYAAIIPATTELTEDSIIDYWDIVTNEVARAYGLVADQDVFTDTTDGILHQSGVLTQPLISGGAASTVSWDDLLSAEGKTEDSLDTSDYVHYMRKDTFFKLAQTKSSGSGVYLSADMLAGWNANPNSPSTPWGTPVKFTRVLPKTSETGSNACFIVYGTLKNTNFYNKNGLALTMLTEATVKDSSGSDFNLATQDGVALRVVVRFLHILPAGNASKFVLIGTGTVS